MNTEQAIEIIEALRCYIGTKNMEKREALRQAWSALREKQERENPQPLTLKQLRERVGKPYYHKSLAGNGNKWLILQPDVAENPLAYNYRETWLAYDNEPKEAW